MISSFYECLLNLNANLYGKYAAVTQNALIANTKMIKWLVYCGLC